VPSTQPSCWATPQAIKQSAAPVQANKGGKPFKRPHSHAPAAIKSTVNAMNGQAALAHKAGSSKASKTKAVKMRCLSMGFQEKGTPKAVRHAVQNHGGTFELKPP
jgi:hypothetical protein